MSEDNINASERLFRNLHPDDFDNGRINSSAFNPSPNHDFKLSTDRSSMVAAQESFNLFVSSGHETIGVCGVTCDDFVCESIACSPDPIPNNPAHALADYSPHGASQRRKKGRKLAKRALEYGFDFLPK